MNATSISAPIIPPRLNARSQVGGETGRTGRPRLSRAAGFCLKEGRITLAEVDVITLGWANNRYPDEMARFYAAHMDHPGKDEYSRIYERISLAQKDLQFFDRRLADFVEGRVPDHG